MITIKEKLNSELETEDGKFRTQAFLDLCWGSWSGDETSSQIKETIKTARVNRGQSI